MDEKTTTLRVIIAGGGTGGHVFPALSVGCEMMKRGAQVVFVGTKKGLESELVHKMGWQIEYIPAPKWKGEGVLKRISAMARIPVSVVMAIKKLFRFKPDVVIGVGGYASVPMLIAAAIKRLPTVLMEQNSIPGLANRILGRVAKRVCITFPSSGSYFNPGKVVFTGNPVREEIRDVSKNLPSFQDTFIVLCFGGSQGAKSINEAMFAGLRFLRNRSHGMKIYHQIGYSMDMEMARDIYEREGFDARVFRFIDDIADCYSRAHMVICRAGATSISELMVAGRPTVLVPYPFAANNHQEENAKYVVEGGGAITVLNRDISGEKIAEIISEFMSHPEKLKAMNEAMLKMAKPDAAEAIVNECFKLCVRTTT